MTNGLDPDQDLCTHDPDLGSNCLQRLSADNKSASSKERVKDNTKILAIFKTIHFDVFFGFGLD